MPKNKQPQLPQLFYDKPATARVRMTKEEADSIIELYSGWIIIGQVWFMRTRPCDDGQTELRLVQAGGLD